MDHPLAHKQLPAPTTSAGQQVRQLRRQAALSQLDLALMAGVSQRHLSCIETGRARASPSTLHVLLSALNVPLDHCNEVFLAAGYAPRYSATPLDAPALEMVRAALDHLLQANDPAPAIVLDSHWNITAANVSTGLLMAMAGVAPHVGSDLNLLQTLFCAGGLGDRLVNAQEVRAAAWQRASREAVGNPALDERLSRCSPPDTTSHIPAANPLLLTRVDTEQGELRFLSTFTTFGMPLDVTVESLRIEHLIPADLATRQRMTSALRHWAANNGHA